MNPFEVRPDELPELQSKPEMKLHVWERSAAARARTRVEVGLVWWFGI